MEAIKQPIDEFITNHNHIYYCEAIIYPDGEIENAVPSHVYAMIRITGEKQEVIDDKMPISSHPLEWLVAYTNCIAVWYNYCVIPKEITELQRQSLKKLELSKIVAFHDGIFTTRETV